MTGRTLIHIFLLSLLFVHFHFAQTILHVGPGQTFSNPTQAATAAHPGDTILIHPSTYTGTFYIENLKGTAQARITIKGLNRDQVIFQGGTESMHLTDPEYLNIFNLTITGQSGNGMNIDDGGSYASPAKHVHIDNCIFKDMAANGNNDMLKLSGLDSFTVSNCRFENGSAGGSGIDMVGCHSGLFTKNIFLNQGSNSIQAKGGSSNIHIERNQFTNGGQRSLNLGGSTGSAFFRPLNANYEAKDLLVTANIFEGSDAPIAYVGCRNVSVINNTIIHPVNWIMRILQESSDTSFYLSSANNTFSNNIVIVNNTLRSDVNIGPNTSPTTFKFFNNLWYNFQNTNWNGPQLPVTETGGIVRQNPLFKNFNAKDFSLLINSPAIGKGKQYGGYEFDFNGKSFLVPPSIGAFEKDVIISSKETELSKQLQVYPNPCKDFLILNNLPEYSQVTLIDLQGKMIYQDRTASIQHMIRMNHLSLGIYILKVLNQNNQQVWLIEKVE
jgi:hypothetical protein